MSHLRIHLLAIVVLALCLGASAHAACPANGLVVVVNKANATEALSMAQLRRLLLGDLRSWPDKKQVTLVTPDTQSAAFKCMLSIVVRMTDGEYQRYIANAEFRGEEPLRPRGAATGRMGAAIVSATPGAIAIVEAGALAEISSTVRVLRINGKQPGESGYPL